MGEMHVRAVKINTSSYAYIFGGAAAAVGRGCDTRGMNIGGSGLSLPLSKQAPALYLYAYIFEQGRCGEDEGPCRGHELKERFTGADRRQDSVLVELAPVDPLGGADTVAPGYRRSDLSGLQALAYHGPLLLDAPAVPPFLAEYFGLLVVINTVIYLSLLVRDW